jgi:hypothetical protein
MQAEKVIDLARLD